MSARADLVGLATLDLIHRVAAPVGSDEKVTALRQDVQAGGPAANAAITFAALGGAARLVTVLGRHPLAAAARADLVAHGVDVVDATPDRVAPPPVSAVRIVDTTGERSVSSVNDSGVDVAADVELDGDLLVLDGWHRALALPAARAARDRGIPVLLGAGSWRPLVEELLPFADYVITSASVRPEQLPAQIVSAHTNGAEAISWRTPQAAGEIAVPRVDPRDTLAAGDVFLGAAAFELAAGNRDWPAVLTFAAQVASRFVTVIGRDGLPSREGISRQAPR